MRVQLDLSDEQWKTLISLLAVVKDKRYTNILNTIKTAFGKSNAQQKKFLEEYDKRVAGN